MENAPLRRGFRIKHRGLRFAAMAAMGLLALTVFGFVVMNLWMLEKWAEMTPEERERFRQGMGGMWGERGKDVPHGGTTPGSVGE